MDAFTTSSLPQGFSVYQPALGAQLQFLPALGTQELDEMIHNFIPGSASIQEKRATVSLDFLDYAQATGQSFKFYPVYSFTSSPAESPVTDSSSFNVSPVTSTWDWNPISTPASSQSSNQAQVSRKSSPSRSQTADFSHIPGMKIMTKEGVDVTNQASRGSKTKEQRDHAHLMRIIKACDACKRKKVRCDPSHKKRSGTSTPSSQPTASSSRVAKKAKISASKPAAVAPVVIDTEAMAVPAAFDFEASFSFAGLEQAEAAESWENFVSFPEDTMEDYNFFQDPMGYFTPSGSSQPSAVPSSSGSPVTSSSPMAGRSVQDVPFDGFSSRDNGGLAHVQSSTEQEPFGVLRNATAGGLGQMQSSIQNAPFDALSNRNTGGLAHVQPVAPTSPSVLDTNIIADERQQESVTSHENLPYMDPHGVNANYTDFNLFSPRSDFSEDDLMVELKSSSSGSIASSSPGHSSLADQQLLDGSSGGSLSGLSGSSSPQQHISTSAPTRGTSRGGDGSSGGSGGLRVSDYFSPTLSSSSSGTQSQTVHQDILGGTDNARSISPARTAPDRHTSKSDDVKSYVSQEVISANHSSYAAAWAMVALASSLYQTFYQVLVTSTTMSQNNNHTNSQTTDPVTSITASVESTTRGRSEFQQQQSSHLVSSIYGTTGRDQQEVKRHSVISQRPEQQFTALPLGIACV